METLQDHRHAPSMIRRSDALLTAVFCILISSVTVFHPREITEWFGTRPKWSARAQPEPAGALGRSSPSPPPSAAQSSPPLVATASLPTSLGQIPATPGTAPSWDVDEASVSETLARFVSFGSRVPGYSGSSGATDEVARRFRGTGLQRVTVEPFRVAVPIDSGACLTIDSTGERLTLHCLWPNGVRTGTTPSGGLRGHLIDAGSGKFKHLDGQRVDGSIALVGFGAGASYMNCRMLGASAVIFYDDGKVTRDQASMKFVKIPLEIPRYWADAEVAARLKALAVSGPAASLAARMIWEEAETANVLGYLEGSSELRPGSRHRWNEDLMVISAPYDAISVVPALAPGAENATSIAALLEVARVMTMAPPGYSVLFLATGAHFEGLTGINEFLRRHSRREEHFRRKISQPERIDFRLFIGIDLSTHSDQVAAFTMGNFYTGWTTNNYQRDMMAPYARRFADYLGEGEAGDAPSVGTQGGASTEESAAAGAEGTDAERALSGKATSASGRTFTRPRFVNAIIPSRRVWKDYMPVPLALDNEAVIFCGQSGITLASPNDPRKLVDTPADTLGALDLANLTRQIETVSSILQAARRDPALFGEEPTGLKDKAYALAGNVCWFNRDTNFALPKDPLRRAIVTYSQAGPVSLAGVRTQMATLTDDSGEFRFDMMRNVAKVKILAYSLDENGEIAFAPDLGVDGAVDYPIEHGPLWYEDRMVEVLFPSKSLSFFDIVDSRLLAPLDVMTVLGTDNAEPQSYGADCIPSQSLSTDRAVLGSVVYARAGTPLKVLMSSGLAGVKYLLTNPDADLFESPVSVRDVGPLALIRAEGKGYEVTGGIISRSLERSATDMWVIDDVRTRLLTRYSVRNERLEILHSEARTALDSARSHLSRLDYSSYMAATRRAAGLENRGYPDVKATASDTTRGVVFYFILLLPFSFFCERLLFGFVGMPRRIAAFAGIFILVFAILRQVHPAFKLSSSAYVIFVAFVMLSMGSIVLILILTRFGGQIRASRQKASAGHDADIGRISATAAAVSLGISNLRRRPIRTGLTAMTLILISFTVLSFTSISTSLRFYRLPRPNPPAYQGILIRDRAWSAFQPFVLEYVESAFLGAGAVSVAPRAWYLSPGTRERSHVPFASCSSGAESFAGGLLGMSSTEPAVTGIDRHLLPGGRWFGEGETGVCIVPDDLAAIVGVRPQDVGAASIELMGQPRRIVGLLNSAGFNRMVDLDNEKLTPYDLVTESAFMNKVDVRDTKLAATAPIQSFTHIESSNTIILPYEDLLELGGTLQSIAIRPGAGESLWGQFLRSVEDFVSRITIPVFVGDGDRVAVYSSMGVASMSGLGQLVVPILIAALIVFNTMTGSVYERVREIGIYSSVGLAPVHIAALFLAEAAVFATIGAVIGYLIGQVFALSFGTSRILEGLSLNYSSLSAVSSTVIVMLTVLLSTLYPAKRASDLAVPDVTRRWHFPEPVGDDWRFEFPFTVASADVVGLYSYLTELFRSYGEGSIGDLLAEDVTLSSSTGDRGPIYVISLKTWLAPYDLGISQQVRLRAEPTQERSIYSIAMHIRRESGDAESWQRINRGFLKILRKRFLMWRTIPASVRDRHCLAGKEQLSAGSLPCPEPAKEGNDT